MSDQDWQTGFAKTLGVFLNGSAIRTMDEHGRHVVDDSFYVMFNAHSEPVEFVLPESKWGEQWTIALDTNDVPEHLTVDKVGRQLAAGSTFTRRGGRSSCFDGWHDRRRRPPSERHGAAPDRWRRRP